ncbi:TonB-dependent receptor [Sediminibacterium ginsengisoli]|uniref:Outer membrane receptor for ferrienterochelin and colicins n=1 Tax=Sediminibacterium ginsengisoli TaxID=413434 RepID=A0A1T4MMV7_9BACT|nr:TonB-dependent receptor [Sediminibacterium ginsengisoli]SJZ68114.1 outer membrane receptor for ferrienterochelin and colicins [Sediminibacterium ginsengisoli]
MFNKAFLLVCLIASGLTIAAQAKKITGKVQDHSGNPLGGASVTVAGSITATRSGNNGSFELNLADGSARYLVIGYTGYRRDSVLIEPGKSYYSITLHPVANQLDDVVVTGTLREMSRSESPVPVEIISHKFFQKNPTPSLFEAIGMVNGVQPQLNCNVCNTGDIHINGMEGPYTLILIDGMPIVSSLATVYGLSGIPNSMVERIEVVKGPASSLYGSEAMGGIVNVITRNPSKAPRVGFDVFGTSWGEVSADVSARVQAGKAKSLLGLNYFNYQQPADHNNDHFTDVTLQNRLSVFNKWQFERKDNRLAAIGLRYVYEDRWGGEMNWTKQWRGSDSIYGESISTRRAELIGMYQLPLREKIMTQFSYNWHNQDSYYGTTPYMATQNVAFIQSYWDKSIGKNHDFIAGASLRYTYYDDNTPATASPDGSTNRPARTWLPGVFMQDEWSFATHHKLLAGYRFDHDKYHGGVHSPRIAYKYSPDSRHALRASFGTGFRVVNLFTEDHAALTGAREVVIAEELKPERSYNANLNYNWKIPGDGFILVVDATAFYSYFTNKIIGGFDTDPTKIIYSNLKGHAISRGISLNKELSFSFPLKIVSGVSYMDVYQSAEAAPGVHEKVQQLHAPRWSGTFAVSYQFPSAFTVDLTGKWSGPMRLPVLPDDYRPAYSPWFCIANIQLTKKFGNGIELYGGAKNMLNFIPANPIMRPFDPFNKTVNDPVNNPYGYTFDPSYNYASLQGIRAFLGVRYNLF